MSFINGEFASKWLKVNHPENGLFTQWYENEQMKSKGTYKDGEVISEKYWNDDGSVME